MKRRIKIIGLLSAIFLLSGIISYADEAKERLLKEANKRIAEAEKRAKEAEKLRIEEAKRMEAERQAQEKAEAEARLAALNEEERAKELARMEEEKLAQAEAARIEAEKRAAEKEAKILEKERMKNMTDSERMDVEIQRIKKRVNEISVDIDEYNKTNEKIMEMERNLGELKRKVNY